MIAEPIGRRILSGRGTAWAAPLRAALSVASWGYRAVITARNAHYDRHGPSARPSVPVISVGNITVGGTGKTPFVMELVRRLQSRGRKPAVISRGYGTRSGVANDEETLIRDKCPGVAYVADPDRGKACERAVRELGADVVVLDDGFQHRRVARDLDIVLIDATCPFGFDRMLPRGLLREPPEALGRAGVIAVTRSDQVVEEELQRIHARLARLAPSAVRMDCRHRVVGIERVAGGSWEEGLEGRRVVLFTGLGNPAAFEKTVSGLGAKVVGAVWFPDHHRYTPSDFDDLRHPDRFPPHDAWVTTEKDAVKLKALQHRDEPAILVVCVAMELMGSDGDALDALLEVALAGGRRTTA